MIYFIVYGFVSAALSGVDFFEAGFGNVVYQIISALIYAGFTVLGLYWAMYLVNMRERAFTRGIAIGLGYGFMYTAWSYAFTYGIPLYYGILMRFGIGDVSDDVKQRVTALDVENMYLFIIDTILYSIIITGVTLIMSHYYVTKENRGMTMFIPLCVQFFISFLNSLLPFLLPDILSSVIYHMVMVGAAVYALYTLLGFLKTGRLAIIPKGFPPSRR